MAELSPGERSYDKVLKPPSGQYTVTSLAVFLRISTECVRRHCAALGIEVGRFVRSEPTVQKTYKAKYRWLTAEEAEQIIARHRAIMGRSD